MTSSKKDDAPEEIVAADPSGVPAEADPTPEAERQRRTAQGTQGQGPPRGKRGLRLPRRFKKAAPGVGRRDRAARAVRRPGQARLGPHHLRRLLPRAGRRSQEVQDLPRVHRAAPPRVGGRALDQRGRHRATWRSSARSPRSTTSTPWRSRTCCTCRSGPRCRPTRTTDSYQARLFVIVRELELRDRQLHTEQVSIFVGHRTVLTFQETPGDVWDPVRQRIRTPGSQLRRNDASFLAYSLIDAVVDEAFPILEQFGDRLEELEDRVLQRPSQDTIQEIHRVKRELLLVRRAMWPMREVLSRMQRDPHECFSEVTRTYIRDVYDHAVQIIDIVETYREMAIGPHRDLHDRDEQPHERDHEGAHDHGHDLHPPDLPRRGLRDELQAPPGARVARTPTRSSGRSASPPRAG